VISYDSSFAVYALRYISRLFTIVAFILMIFGESSDISIGPVVMNPDNSLFEMIIVWFVYIVFFTFFNVLVTIVTNLHLKHAVEKIVDCGMHLEVSKNKIKHKIVFEDIKSVDQLECYSPARLRICLGKDYGFGRVIEFTPKPTNFWNANDSSKTYNSIRNRIKKMA